MCRILLFEIRAVYDFDACEPHQPAKRCLALQLKSYVKNMVELVMKKKRLTICSCRSITGSCFQRKIIVSYLTIILTEMPLTTELL